MESTTLQEIITQYVHLPLSTNSHGWYPIGCKVCNDHGKKGKRAGFRFEDNVVGFNCFNCGHSALYNPAKNKKLSKNMIIVMDAFGIPSTEWSKASFDALVNEYTEDHQPIQRATEPSEIPLLPFFYPLTDDVEDEWCQYSIEYLTNRKIDWKSYPFYCVKKMNHPDNKRWYGRLIIPVFKDKKLIFYQGRDLTDLHQKKYLSATTQRDNILYGYDQLYLYNNNPLYVVEGWFDAYHIDGIATFGNRITQQQMMWLNRSQRPKVIIPDRLGDGFLMAEQAIQQGWKISTLDQDDDCKDVNDSIIKHGMIYTIKKIVENTVEGVQAQVVINTYCKGKRHGRK